MERNRQGRNREAGGREIQQVGGENYERIAAWLRWKSVTYIFSWHREAGAKQDQP